MARRTVGTLKLDRQGISSRLCQTCLLQQDISLLVDIVVAFSAFREGRWVLDEPPMYLIGDESNRAIVGSATGGSGVPDRGTPFELLTLSVVDVIITVAPKWRLQIWLLPRWHAHGLARGPILKIACLVFFG